MTTLRPTPYDLSFLRSCGIQPPVPRSKLGWCPFCGFEMASAVVCSNPYCATRQPWKE